MLGQSLSYTGGKRVDWCSLSGGQPGSVPNNLYMGSTSGLNPPISGNVHQEMIRDVADMYMQLANHESSLVHIYIYRDI